MSAEKLNAKETGAAIRAKFNAHADQIDTQATKLSGIATGATANDTDANLKNRANHTGSQPASTITQNAAARFVTDTEKSTWNGKANTLDIPAAETGATILSKLSANNVPLPVALLPDANLSSAQFEVLGDGTIGIKTSYLQSLNLGGTTTPANTTPIAPTLTADDTANTLTASHALGTSEIVMSVNDAAYVAYAPISVGNVARAAGYWKFKIKATTGRNESAVVSSPAFTVAATGGTYTIERTFNVNFGSEYGTYSAATWNAFKPTSAMLGAANGFTSAVLKDTTGVNSTITVKNSGAFSGSTAEISPAQTTAGNTGAFANEIVNSGWIYNGSTPGALKIEGLNASKFYQLYFLLPTKGASEQVRGVTIGGVTKNKATSNILSSFGTAANGLQDPEFIVFNNITGTTIDAVIARVSGEWDQQLACLVIQESNIAKP